VDKCEEHHVCPVWVGYLLASPIRKILQDPRKILGPHVAVGMRVMDIGCAMGFFSVPLARLVGQDGCVVCLDLQQKMLDVLQRRARRAHLAGRVETRLCGSDSLGVPDLAGQIDFALAFGVVHEVVDPVRLFSEIHSVLKPGGRVLVAEPKGRVTERSFQESLATAGGNGFHSVAVPNISRSYAVVLERNKDTNKPIHGD